MHEQSVPEQHTPTGARAPESGAATLNEAPAAEGNLAKRQMALAGESKPTAQDELQAADKASEQSAADAQFMGGAKVAGNTQNGASAQGSADSAGVPIEARRARSQASSGASTSAAAPALQSAVPLAAARLVDPAAELRHAAGSGDMPALRSALERRPLIDARDADGRSALMLAVLHGRGDAVDELLAAGADPNAADVHGTTPLQAALDGAQADIAAALRRAGAR